MNDTGPSAQSPWSGIARKSTWKATVGSALLLWLIPGLVYGIILALDEPFLRSQPWVELLIFDSMWLVGSLLLLVRDRISLQAAGVCLSKQSISWLPNLAALLAIQLTGSVVLFALHAPGTVLSSLSLAQKLLWVGVLSPISEEVFLRGWFQTAYLRALGAERTTSAILASAALFAGMHLLVSTSLLRIGVTVIAAFLSGLVYAKVRQASASLFPAVLMHSVFNLSGWLIAPSVWLMVCKLQG